MISWKHLFEFKMRTEGRAVAPNGAHYEITMTGPNEIPACIRIHLGKRIIVMGFGEQRFQSRDDAIRWALADGCYLVSTPLRERYQVA